MTKKFPILVLIILMSELVYAQSEDPALLFSDFIQLPSDTLNHVFFTYKIPLEHLVFEKEANLFLAQYRISIEVFDADGQKFITRAIKEKNIQVPDYEQTTSQLIYSEGILNLNLNPGNYSIVEILYDYKSDREFKLPAYNLKIDSAEKIFSPLVTDEHAIECIRRNLPVLTNYGGKLPFDEEKYALLIPVKINGLDSLYVNIVQNEDTLFNKLLVNPAKEKITFSECGGKILLDQAPDSGNNGIYSIEGISGRIKEGAFRINISFHRDFSHQRNFLFECKWINKPVSLRNAEMAIKALKFVENDSVINSLLQGDEKEYSWKLAAYWKKIDPTPETEFNPLMQEFYNRIDYAVKKFTTIAGTNGANTDRGKIYIKFGKPVDIARTSDNHGNIIETWTYNNPQRKFVFVDKKGTGEFLLISG